MEEDGTNGYIEKISRRYLVEVVLSITAREKRDI